MTASASPVVAYVVGTAGAVIDTGSSLLGGTSALLTGSCSSEYEMCTINFSGGITNLLTDGASFLGQAKVSVWMQNGHAYGSATLSGVAPLPFALTCNKTNTTNEICTGNVSGSITQVLLNGAQIALWGWATPSGYWSAGNCVGSATLLGDPGYKAKARGSVASFFGFSDDDLKTH